MHTKNKSLYLSIQQPKKTYKIMQITLNQALDKIKAPNLDTYEVQTVAKIGSSVLEVFFSDFQSSESAATLSDFLNTFSNVTPFVLVLEYDNDHIEFFEIENPKKAA